MRVFTRNQDVAKYGAIEDASVARMLSEGWAEIADTYVPTPEELAAIIQREMDVAALTQVKADATVRYLTTHTPQECYDKVMADVTNFAQAKEMMARLAMAVSAGLRKQLR